jgi:hypothetical protein
MAFPDHPWPMCGWRHYHPHLRMAASQPQIGPQLMTAMANSKHSWVSYHPTAWETTTPGDHSVYILWYPYQETSAVHSRPTTTPGVPVRPWSVASRLNATAKVVAERFVWPWVQKDCRNWACACQSFQRSKVSRHTVTPLGDFMLPATRLLHIHETNCSATDKFQSAVNANPTAAHKQHHHCLSLELHAMDTMFISLLNSTSKQSSPRGEGCDVGTAHIKSGIGQSQSSRCHLLSNGQVNTFPQQWSLLQFNDNDKRIQGSDLVETLETKGNMRFYIWSRLDLHKTANAA